MTADLLKLYPDMELLTVTARRVPPDAIVLAVCGAVDLSTASILQNSLLAHMYDGAARVVVDLTGVRFLSAAGLTVLVNVKQAAATAGNSLCLIARTRAVLLPLTITSLDGEFDIRPAPADPPLFSGEGPDA